MKKWMKWGIGGVVALIVIAAIAGGSGDEKKDDAATTTPTAVDTGRMSDGEFSSYMTMWSELLNENQQLGNDIQKCGVLMEALQLAEASKCTDDAFDGLDTNVRLLRTELDGVKDDVAKKCLVAVRQMVPAVDAYGSATDEARAAGKNLQFTVFEASVRDALNQHRRLQARHEGIIRECTPEGYWERNNP